MKLTGLCGQSWAALRAYVNDPLGLGALGAYVGGLGPVCWRSWAALGAYVDEKTKNIITLENVIISEAGARSAAWGVVLSRSWGLCWRSWAALGVYVGDLGPTIAKNMATLKMCLFIERERDLQPGGRS